MVGSGKMKIINEVTITKVEDTEEVNMFGNYNYDRYVFKYDERDKLFENSKHYWYKGGLELLYNNVYDYDENGVLLNRRTFNDEGKMVDLWEYEHDNKGNNTQITINLVNSVYDETGEYIGPNPTLGFKQIYLYDNLGQMVKDTRLNKDGNIDYYSVFEYSFFNPESSEVSKVVKRKYDEENKLESIEITINNKKGDWVEQSKFTGEGVIIETLTRQIQYQEGEKDWVKSVEYLNGIFNVIRSREIEHKTTKVQKIPPSFF